MTLIFPCLEFCPLPALQCGKRCTSKWLCCILVKILENYLCMSVVRDWIPATLLNTNSANVFFQGCWTQLQGNYRAHYITENLLTKHLFFWNTSQQFLLLVDPFVLVGQKMGQKITTLTISFMSHMCMFILFFNLSNHLVCRISFPNGK